MNTRHLALAAALSVTSASSSIQHPFALLATDQGEADGQDGDKFVVLLPVLAAPVFPGSEVDDALEIMVTLQAGQAKWLGADGKIHSIGGGATPLPAEIQKALESDDGLLVAFTDEAQVQLARWAIFKTQTERA